MRVPEEIARGTISRIGRWVRGECGHCHEQDVLLYDTDVSGPLVCAGCYRVWTATQPKVKQLCDSCGSDGNVWRDPIPRKNVYLCVNCHDPDALFLNRWANKVRQSEPLNKGEKRAVCGAAGYGTDCSGEIKWRGPQSMQLCNKHAGKKGSETWIGSSGLLP